MPPSRRTSRTTLSVRVRKDVLERLRTFVRDHAGKPLYLNMAEFVEDAVAAHIVTCEQRLEGESPTTRNSNRFLNPNGRR